MIKSRYEELFLTTTDTVTGIGAPVSKENFKAIVDVKSRDPKKPFIIMVGSLKQAESFKEWTPKAAKLAKEYWPGATTLVLSDTLALRLPDSKELRDLILQLGPVYMTSANISGEPALPLEEAKGAFYEIKTFYNFGAGSGKPSQIIDVKTGNILRA